MERKLWYSHLTLLMPLLKLASAIQGVLLNQHSCFSEGALLQLAKAED